MLKKSNRVKELDGLRGTAILLVLLWHYGTVFPTWCGKLPEWIFPIKAAMGMGWTGVDLFFVLSGFLIGGIILDKSAKDSKLTFLKKFYLRRTCRIFPLYFLLLAGVLTTLWFQGGWTNGTYVLFQGEKPQQIPWGFSAGWYCVFLQNIAMVLFGDMGNEALSVTWSLAVEEQFYLLLPLVLLLLPRNWVSKTLWLGILAAIATRLCLCGVGNYGGTYVLTFCRMDTLLLGVLGASWTRTAGFTQWWMGHKRLGRAALSVLAVGSAVFAYNGNGPVGKCMSMHGRTWFALFYLAVLLNAITNKESWTAKLARTGFLRFFGKISYGLYLVHIVLLRLCTSAMGPRPATVVAALLGSVVLSVILQKYVEAPCIEFGHQRSERPKIDTASILPVFCET